jgi:tetratricopeptide (TPR) repeat protein
MNSFCLILVSFICQVALAQPTNDSLLQQLDIEIENRQKYVNEKLVHLEAYKASAQKARLAEKYEIYSRVYDSYKSFIYDSAFFYARRLQRIAKQLNDPGKISHSKIKIGFVLVSAGMFNEALDTLRSVKTATLPDSIKTEFYYIMSRVYYDLSDFNRDDYYRRIYTQRAEPYIDSALAILPPRSVQYLLLNGLRGMHQQDMDGPRKSYETLMKDFKLTDQQLAIVASTLSFIYLNSDNRIKAKEMLIRAAIADIRSCTKETLAMLRLAEMLLDEGDIENAYKYVKIAMEDADFYGARQRKTQVGAVFPIIEGKQLSAIESKRKTLFIYSLLITVFTLSAVGFSFVIYKQNKKLQKARRLITKANMSLTETNHKLEDANKIKEEYIWYYFNTTAEYITKLDSLKKSLDLKLMTKKMEELRFTVDSINIKREREELYHNFDKVFLKLFPDFVNVFNALFKEEDRMVLKEGQLLNTELRIFALIRMGIHDHERIAKILDYSVTTIYTYKTRIRNKSLLENDEFDRQIMSIRAI